MELKGIDFGHVFTSSGGRGFVGEGYSYDKLPPWRWMDDSGATFVSKTVTLRPRMGNMMLKDGLAPQEFKPRCIVVKFFKEAVLNAVGLSNLGAKHYFDLGLWQQMRQPFFISFASVGDEAEMKTQIREFAVMLKSRLPEFKSPVGLELNYGCPNVGQSHHDLLKQVKADLDVVGRLGIPVMPNFGPLIEPDTVSKIAQHPACDAISIANSIPWGSCPELIKWKEIFGSDTSPLEDLGGGALSGRPIFPVIERWIEKARTAKIGKPVVIGGGIMSEFAAEMALRRGFAFIKGIKLGVVRLLRPWRVRGIIDHVNADLERAAWHPKEKRVE